MKVSSPKRGKKPSSTKVTDAVLRAWPLPELDGKLGKSARGTALVVGGGTQIPGAVVLAATAALRAGAGRVQIVTARTAALPVAVALPEARVIGLRESKEGELAKGSLRAIDDELRRCDALLLGPGMRDPCVAVEVAKHHDVKNGEAIVVVDAAALTMFTRRRRGPVRSRRAARVIITPHAGEMAEMWGVEREEVLARPAEIALEAAAHFGVVVALKGPTTYVAGPGGRAFHDTTGNLGLGTSGSGDTLAGIIAGLAARGADALQATVWGVHLHGTAGDMLARRTGPLGFLARELLPEIPPLLGALSRPSRQRR